MGAIRELKRLAWDDDIPADWQGKIRTAELLNVSLNGLPYSGADECLLLNKNGPILDARIRDARKQAREKIRWAIYLLGVICAVLAVVPRFFP